jgi:hypothetical protein
MVELKIECQKNAPVERWQGRTIDVAFNFFSFNNIFQDLELIITGGLQNNCNFHNEISERTVS